MRDCIAELQCWGSSCLNSVLSKPWPCLEVNQIHYSENVSFRKSFCSSSSRTSGRHKQGLCPWLKFLKNNRILSSPRPVSWEGPRQCGDRTGKLISAYPGGSGNLYSQREAGECSITRWYCSPLKIQYAWASAFVLGAFVFKQLENLSHICDFSLSAVIQLPLPVVLKKHLQQCCIYPFMYAQSRESL